MEGFKAVAMKRQKFWTSMPIYINSIIFAIAIPQDSNVKKKAIDFSVVDSYK